jgi:hypothetical protein
VEERHFRVGSFFEWAAAAAGVALVGWLISVPVQRLIGPRVEASIDAPAPLPAGVPGDASGVPVMMLLDGREIRLGDAHSRLVQLLPDKLVDGPIARSNTDSGGERHTRAYVVNGMRFYVVCERPGPAAPLRVSGIYLPEGR